MARSRKDLTGKVFGRLRVISWACNRWVGRRRSFWKCVCECGKTAYIRVGDLNGGKTKSCGCLKQEVMRTSHTTHNGSYSSEYHSWSNMVQRCTNPNRPDYRHYGGRGIKIYKPWLSFAVFTADVGARPSPKHSLDRIDNSADYTPDNCRWATVEEQRNNMRSNVRVTAFGITKTAAEWSAETGIKRSTLRDRLNNGWEPERAVSIPVKAV